MNDSKHDNETNFSPTEEYDIEGRSRLRAAVVYEIVAQDGEEELRRGLPALWWSGVAAGFSIGFSMVTRGLLRAGVGDQPWGEVVDSLGYSVGFVIVVMARQQLFTENTITVVLPLMADRSLHTLRLVARLWAVVFLANMVGAVLFAGGVAYGGIFPQEVLAEFVAISEEMMANSPGQMLTKGIAAGWLIATVVWLLPSAEAVRLWVIVLPTYVIALGGFTHVVAGAVEASLLVLVNEAGVLQAVFGFLLPTLAGNIIGGSALFALISYAQVRREI